MIKYSYLITISEKIVPHVGLELTTYYANEATFPLKRRL